MNPVPKIAEKVIHEIWIEQHFEDELTTISGESVHVMDIGSHNVDCSGPDFHNSRIRIGQLVFVGDIEIDNDYSDWKAHGHSEDKKYNRVILHLTLHNKNNHPFVYSQEGRKIHTLCLAHFLSKETLALYNYEPETVTGSLSPLKCSEHNSSVDVTIKTELLYELGIERFKKKCEKMYARLKELAYIKELNLHEPVIGYDNQAFYDREFSYHDFQDREIWKQLFYEYLFEALGYAKNKTIMLSLAQSVNVSFFQNNRFGDNRLKFIKACLFNIAGLIPENGKIKTEEGINYSKSLREIWEHVKMKYDGRTFENIDWYYFKLRPQNFPTLRIAGGAVLLEKIIYENLLGKIIKKFEELRSHDLLIKKVKSYFMVFSYGFWRKHYVFDQPAEKEIKFLIGESRTDEIFVNVVLPFITIYGEIYGSTEISKKAFEIYSEYNQKADNSIVRFISQSLCLEDTVKKSIYGQGMIELFRSYCLKGKCRNCSIGKASFS